MKATIRWEGDAQFRAIPASGHEVLMDGPPDIGGRNLGPRPMEMLLMGVGGCSSIDVILILKKARQKVVDCWVELESERAPEPPRVFTKIHAHFVVVGHNLDDKHVERAIQLSKEKYCSASVQLGALAEITTSFETRAAEV